MRKITARAALAVALAVPVVATTTAASAPTTLPNAQKTGSQLVNRFMAHLNTGNTAKLNALLAPSFIVQRANGTWAGKAAYLAQLPMVTQYDISSTRSAYSQGALTVRWEVATVETLPGGAVGRSPAPRLSTFVWTPAGFRMTSHGNFNPPVA